MILYGTRSRSFCTSASVNLRPIRRFTAYRVFLGLVTAWRLADWPDQHFAVLGERDDRRRGAVAFAVLDDLGLAAFHDGDAGVGGAEVDADDLAHVAGRPAGVRSRTCGPGRPLAPGACAGYRARRVRAVARHAWHPAGLPTRQCGRLGPARPRARNPARPTRAGRCFPSWLQKLWVGERRDSGPGSRRNTGLMGLGSGISRRCRAQNPAPARWPAPWG
jgi:hypothetical protein